METELKRERIIAAHAGTGKTTLANQYPEKFTDFVSMPYKYILPEIFDESESESCKANPDYEMNFDWPENYFEAILSELNNSDKIIVIPPDWQVLRMLSRDEIPHILCYPENTEEAKEIYRQRFIARGNTEYFLEIFIGGWDMFMSSFAIDTFARHIVLRPHQFLTDIIDEICR